jgi:hypothetical protein
MMRRACPVIVVAMIIFWFLVTQNSHWPWQVVPVGIMAIGVVTGLLWRRYG